MYKDINKEDLKVHSVLGYVYFLDKDHPLRSGNANFVYYHRHVISLKLNRWINKDEIVHHIDHDKQNNSCDNLEILNIKEHAKKHANKIEEKICPECSILFTPNKNKDKYCCKECYYSSLIKDKIITKEILEPLLWQIPFSILGPSLGYTDTGIKKRGIKLGCIMPPPRFHTVIKPDAVKLQKYKEALKA